MQTILSTSLQTQLRNPVIALGSAAIIASAIIALWSASMLLSTLLYRPTLELFVTKDTRQTASVNAGSIGQRNFFGLADVKPDIIVDQLPETQLQLTLRGAFTATIDSNAGAIIEDDRQKSSHYSIGESLPGNAVLKSVHRDKVVLTRNGVFETLYFPEAKPANNASGNSASPLNITNVSSAESEKRRQAIRERINKLRNKKK